MYSAHSKMEGTPHLASRHDSMNSEGCERVHHKSQHIGTVFIPKPPFLTMTHLRRIQKELTDLSRSENRISNLTYEVDDSNILEWMVTVKGADGPYKGGNFKFKMTFTEQFPFQAPTVKFMTKIYHPGINEEGAICLPMLKDEWKPAITLHKVLSTIAEKENKTKFLATAKEWTSKYAK
ncbi:UBC-like protein [Clavulina sp. PMI_390]|nr:UBC-like protein [Clavulina sp. PMI_390]